MNTRSLSRFVCSALVISAIFHSCGALGKITPWRGKTEAAPQVTAAHGEVMLGIDVLINYRLDAVRGKRVGLITNPSGVNRSLQSTIDILHRHPQVQLTALYAPEHGIRGNAAAGETVSTSMDNVTGLPVYSLYGDTRKPTQEMLANIDILMFDIQDIGVRPYTYMSTMAYAMEAAKEAGIPFCVLDRPNPLGGTTVDGAVLNPAFKSFIGLYPIPYVHGMTAGELAWLFNREFGIETELLVVPLEGWSRDMLWQDTGLRWVPTSPHIPEASTVFCCAATGCMGELGAIQCGIGYTAPFKMAGAPWIDPNKLATELNGRNLPGITFRPCYWTPFYGLWKGEQVGGVQLHVTDQHTFLPFTTGIHILEAIHTLYPEQDIFPADRTSGFNRAAGTDQILKKLRAGLPADIIIDSYKDDLCAFRQLREKYFLYR